MKKFFNKIFIFIFGLSVLSANANPDFGRGANPNLHSSDELKKLGALNDNTIDNLNKTSESTKRTIKIVNETKKISEALVCFYIRILNSNNINQESEKVAALKKLNKEKSDKKITCLEN